MNRKIIVAAIGFVVAVAIGLHFWAEWEKARFDASLPTPPAAEEQQVSDDMADDTAGDTTGGHWHGDEWHGEPHRDAVLDEGMHFADVQNPVGAPVTDNAELPAEIAEILATPKYVEKLQHLQRMLRKGYYSREWVEWEEKTIQLEAEKELLDREYPLWAPDGTATREEIEKHISEENQRIANMTEEERLAMADKLEEHIRKSEDLEKRRVTHAAKMPSSVSGGQQ